MAKWLVGSAGAVAVVALDQMEAPNALLWFTAAAMLIAAAVVQWWKSKGGALALVVVVGCWAGVVVYVMRSVQAGPSTAVIAEREPERAKLSETKKALESNLMLVEVYPHYQWKLSGVTTPAEYPLDGTTLSEKFATSGEYRLTPMIRNGNDGIPLFDPEMFISLPSEIGVKRPAMWRPLDAPASLTSWWASRFAAQIPGRSTMGIDESLFLTFPRPDLYPIRWRIRGLAQGISLDRSGTVLLRLVATP